MIRQDQVHLVSGSIDGQLKMFDINSNTDITIGSHENAIKSVEYSSKVNGVITGSWDKVSHEKLENFIKKLIYSFSYLRR